MKRILTGDRPTFNKFHLGNYVGSLENRVKLQNEYDSFIMLADLHALTTHFDVVEGLENENIIGLMKDYLSVGLDPNKVTFFVQSGVPQIVQVAYFLSTLTSRGVIERQPALKEKLDQGEQDTVALFYYPVLMAADILTIQGNLVPVGKDQKAHVEFARDIAERFNTQFGQTFTIPQPLIGNVPTLVGTDGQAKMSKSLNNAIYLTDNSDEVEKKVMSMYTDPTRIKATDLGHIEGNPVFIYLDAFRADQDKEQIAKYKEQYKEGQVGDIEVKKYLVQILNNFLDPIREKRKEWEDKDVEIKEILSKGCSKAREIGEKTVSGIKEVMHMPYLHK